MTLVEILKTTNKISNISSISTQYTYLKSLVIADSSKRFVVHTQPQVGSLCLSKLTFNYNYSKLISCL